MKAALVPIILSLAGLGLGAGVGFVLHTPDAPDPELVAQALEQEEPDQETGADFVKLNNQFVVPVVKEGRVTALVVTSLQLQVTTGTTDAVYEIEPRIRDLFLQVLFDHANAGGFDGNFTEIGQRKILRRNLLEAGRQELGDDLQDVLFQNLDRQDV